LKIALRRNNPGRINGVDCARLNLGVVAEQPASQGENSAEEKGGERLAR
jgi:hypothetical protein